MVRIVLTLRKMWPLDTLRWGSHTDALLQMYLLQTYHGRAKRLGAPGAVWPMCHIDKHRNRWKYFHFYAILEESMSSEMGASQPHHIIIGFSGPVKFGRSFFSVPAQPQTTSSALTMFPRMLFSIQCGDPTLVAFTQRFTCVRILLQLHLLLKTQHITWLLFSLTFQPLYYVIITGGTYWRRNIVHIYNISAL